MESRGTGLESYQVDETFVCSIFVFNNLGKLVELFDKHKNKINVELSLTLGNGQDNIIQ